MKKTLAMILAVVMLMTACVAGTLAWLQDTTQEVKNTFTIGNIDITLAETGTTTVEGVDTKSYKMIPGATLSKDPKVTVVKGSEACWVFVEVVEANGTVTVGDETFDMLDYTVNSAWTKLEGEENVYYLAQASLVDATSDAAYSVLTGDKVVIPNAVTKAAMEAVGTNYPTLSFKAYAIQQANGDKTFTAAEAWAALNG